MPILLSSGRCCLYTGTCPRAPCIVCRVATRLCSSAAPGTPDKTIYKLKPLSSPKRNRFQQTAETTFSALGHTVQSYLCSGNISRCHRLLLLTTSWIDFPGFDSRLNDASLSFCFFLAWEGPYVKQTNFQGRWAQCQKTMTERRARKNPSKKIHSPIYFTLYGP